MATNTDIEVKVVAVADKAISDLQKLKKSVSDFGGETEKSFSKGTKSSSDFGASLVKGGLAAAAAAVSFGAIKNTLVMLYNTGLENEKIQLKLATALGFTSKALSEQASALQRKGIADDDQIQAMQAMLANYAKSESAILALTPAVLDLAAATGVDMVTAATLVGRAIADDGAELGRYKIKVDGAAGSNERAQSVIEGLSEKFGGQAQAAANAAGAVNTLALSWGGLMDKIGGNVKKEADIFAGAIGKVLRLGEGGDQEKIVGQIQRLQARRVGASKEMIEYINKETRALADQLKVIQSKNIVDGGGAITGLGTGTKTQAELDAMAAAEKEKQKLREDAAAQQLAFEKEQRQIIYDVARKSDSEKKELHEKTHRDTVELSAKIVAAKQAEADQIALINDMAAKENKRRLEQEKADTEARINMGMMYANQTIATMTALAVAAKANQEEMKAVRIAGAVIDGASTLISANRAIAGSSTEQYSMIAAMIVMDALIVAQTAAQIATIANAAEGGIVPGNSRTGDRVTMGLNSGEIVLNERKQQNLLNMLEGGGGGGGIVINLDARGVDASTAYALNRSSRAIAREVEKSFRNGTLSMARLTKR